MLRRCSVFECTNARKKTRCFPFPQRNKELALIWRQSLQLQEFVLDDLIGKYFVCAAHFVVGDFDKTGNLTLTAVPTLNVNNSGCEPGRKVSAWQNASKMLLQLPALDALQCENSMSSTCTTDIVLNDEEENEEEEFYETALAEGSMTDFTVLDANPQYECQNSDKPPGSKRTSIDESTEVLMLLNSEYMAHNMVETNALQKLRKSPLGTSCTDSDVEILMSEEINESDWSADCSVALDEYDVDACIAVTNTQQQNDSAQLNSVEGDEEIEIQDAETPSASIQRESTGQDISVEEFSCTTTSSDVINAACDNEDSMSQLSRAQLLAVIRSQGLRIRELEKTLQRFREAQQTLFSQVDALRIELQMERDESFDTIH